MLLMLLMLLLSPLSLMALSIVSLHLGAQARLFGGLKSDELIATLPS